MNHLQITFFPSARLFLQLLCTATLVLSGCSGGGTSAVQTKATTITVIDGYIQGATVCVDKNDNGACDDGETKGTTTTGADGKVTLNIPVADVGKYTILALIPKGAIDSVTGEVLTAFSLKAPAKSPATVTPFTTMIQQIINSGSDHDTAVQFVVNSTGKQNPTDDFTSDFDYSTQAMTMIALQIDRTNALDELKLCKASYEDKQKQILSAIVNESVVTSIKTQSKAITACGDAVAQKSKACKTAINSAVTNIVNANISLSTASLQELLKEASCHKLS